jgi:hypothetical protein
MPCGSVSGPGWANAAADRIAHGPSAVGLLQGYLETIYGEPEAALIAKIVEWRPTTVDIS